jgi:hypothetical protein
MNGRQHEDDSMGLFRWFRREPLAAAELGRKPALALPDMGLDEAIAAIAALRSEPAIQEAARQFPERYGPEVIPELRRRFDVMAEPPPSFSAREPSVCAWASRWWVALYEILYQYREQALPVFREMARDGHNGTAIVLLCRLAAEGVDRQQIVADLRSLMPDLPCSARCDIAAQLLWLARKDPAVASVVEELRQEPAFEQALVEARQSGDECDGPPVGGPGRPNLPPPGVVGRRAVFVAITFAFGVWVAVAVVGSTGVWGAAWVGAFAAAVSAAVIFLVEMAVLNKM